MSFLWDIIGTCSQHPQAIFSLTFVQAKVITDDNKARNYVIVNLCSRLSGHCRNTIFAYLSPFTSDQADLYHAIETIAIKILKICFSVFVTIIIILDPCQMFPLFF